MTRRLILTYLLITAAVLAVLEIPLAVTFKSREESRFLSAVERDARVIATQVEERLEKGTGADPVSVALDYRDTIGGRAVVVDQNGRSVADSDHPEGPSEDFSTREEIAAALDGKVSAGIRRSETLGRRLIYVAVPVASSGQVHGAVRITYPASELDRRVRSNWLNLGLLAGSILIGVAVAGWLLARSVTRPVAQLRAATARLAAGDLSAVPTRRPARRRCEVSPMTSTTWPAGSASSSVPNGPSSPTRRTSCAPPSPRFASGSRAWTSRPTTMTATSSTPPSRRPIASSASWTRCSRWLAPTPPRRRSSRSTPRRSHASAASPGHRWPRNAPSTSATSGPPPRPAVAVDGALEQIVDNLVANALEASPDGTTITVGLAAGPTTLTLTVDDQGPGMTDDQLLRAKDRFWRAPDARPGGTGLGLAIIEQLARQSGGALHLSRNGDGGLRAVVTLPLPTPAPMG